MILCDARVYFIIKKKLKVYSIKKYFVFKTKNLVIMYFRGAPSPNDLDLDILSRSSP